MYTCVGYEKYGGVDGQGGGSIPLAPDGIVNFAKWLVNVATGFLSFEEVILESDGSIFLVILWIGIGYAEEAILLVLCLRKLMPKLNLRIIGIDIHLDVIEAAQRNVAEFECSDENGLVT